MRGPRRSDRRRWETFHPERTVLAVARTFTSTVRLLDALTVFRGDFRVEVLFTFDDSSAFSPGVHDLLRAYGVRIVPWNAVEEYEFDLVLTASENIELDRLDAPIVVIPHGIGFNKFVPDSAGPGDRISGVVPVERMRGKSVWMLTSHPDQERWLRSMDPEAAERCVVVGDPTYDRMLGSLPLRGHYRHAMGVPEGHRLVVVTSTWKDGSTLGRWQELPTLLLGALPADEYRVALVTHPNIRSWHGEYQTDELWLPDSYDAGLSVVPPAQGWQAALIAADVVIGDHGSVTLYAAALDRPVLLAALGEEVVPETPPDELAHTAETLDRELPLREQVDRAVDGHRPGRFAELADRMFARRGEAVRALHELLYRRLDLPTTGAPPAVRAVPEPHPRRAEPRSFVVFSRLDGPGSIAMWRFPAAVRTIGLPDARAVRHLCVIEGEPDLRRPQNASVLVRGRSTGYDAAVAWVAETFHRYPGVRVVAAAVEGGCVAGLRDDDRLVVASGGDTALTASAVYTFLRTGSLADGPTVLRSGGIETTIRLELRPADGH